jgi:hypothetical protein
MSPERLVLKLRAALYIIATEINLNVLSVGELINKIVVYQHDGLTTRQ